MKKNDLSNVNELDRIKKSRFRLLCLLISFDILLVIYLVIEIIIVFARN